LEKTLQENEANHGQYLKLEKLLKENSNQRKPLEGAEGLLENARKQALQFEKIEHRKRDELEKELARWTGALGEQVTFENFMSVIQSKREKFKDLSDGLGANVDEFKKLNGILASKKKELEDSISKLGSPRLKW